MNSKAILGISFAAVFVFAMMTNPVFAVSPNLKIDSVDGFSMTVEGNAPGHGVAGHLIIVYAFFTDEDAPGDSTSFIAEVAAIHPKFSDDSEQVPVKPIIHQHELYLDKVSLCVTGLDAVADPEVSVDGSTVTVEETNDSGNVVAYVIAGYDFTEDGLCPTEVYDIVVV